MQTLIILSVCLAAVCGGLVRRAVPASSYVRTEEGQKVAIPGLETTTTIDNALEDVFGETTLTQDNDTVSSTAVAPSSQADGSGATSTTPKYTTPKPTTEETKVIASSTTQNASTEKKEHATSASSSTTAVPASSSESTPKAPGGGSFGFNVAFPSVPTLPPFDKIKIPNPLGGLFSG